MKPSLARTAVILVCALLAGCAGTQFTRVAGDDEQAVRHLYSQTTGGAFNLKFFQKRLLVTASRQGVVTEAEYVESGSK